MKTALCEGGAGSRVPAARPPQRALLEHQRREQPVQLDGRPPLHALGEHRADPAIEEEPGEPDHSIMSVNELSWCRRALGIARIRQRGPLS
jgi:hypothetical protein